MNEPCGTTYHFLHRLAREGIYSVFRTEMLEITARKLLRLIF